jgi:hypothetical protein
MMVFPVWFSVAILLQMPPLRIRAAITACR